MSETDEATGAPSAENGTAGTESPRVAWPIISVDDFRTVDFEAPVRGLAKVHPHKLYEAYCAAAHVAEEKGDERASRVFVLLVGVTGMFLRPRDKANPWVPMFSSPAGSTPTPSAFRGEQSANFKEILSETVHPALRARLADIVWTNARREGAAAGVAANGYRECIEGLVNGRFSAWIESSGANLLEAIEILQRMLQIIDTTTKKAKRPDWMSQTLEIVYNEAKIKLAYVAFIRAAELGLYYELITESRVAVDAEAVARTGSTDVYPMAVRGCWTLAARLFDKMKDAECVRRCRIGALECTLAMRHHVLGSAGAEASWVMDALQELRHISGMEEKEQELELELRRLQRASLSEMSSIPIELEVETDQDAIVKLFSEMNFSDCLMQFALLSHSIEPHLLRTQALDLAESAPITATMPIKIIDDEGRTVVKVPGSPSDGEPDDAWFCHMISRLDGLRMLRTVAGLIDPARSIIQARFGIEERHLAPIIGYSPFVPDSQKPLLTLGFTRFFQGDLMSAAYLIVPQLEPCLRHVLKINGHDPVKRRDDSTEEDLSLDGIFRSFKNEFVDIFGLSITDEIDRLFNRRPGPALRHEFAHGQMSGGACFHPYVGYAIWLFYRICCLPLVRNWKPAVEQAIELQQ